MDQNRLRGEAIRASVRDPILLVDSYARGISIGRAGGEQKSYELQIDGDAKDGAGTLRSRYLMRSGEPLKDLDRHLSRLSSRGELRRTTVVFGVTTDPFHPFDEKFATSMRFLELFERYAPGRLVIQTRSPLIVIGLPILKRVRGSTVVMIGIETPLDDVRRRLTPGLPSVDERWKTVRALKRFGCRVGVQVSPILPYGDWRADAGRFADELARDADFISVRSIAQVSGAGRPRGVLAEKLSAERQFFWLRADAHRPLHDALSQIAPDRLYHPAEVSLVDPQISLFGS
jgi:hypothetical protein